MAIQYSTLFKKRHAPFGTIFLLWIAFYRYLYLFPLVNPPFSVQDIFDFPARKNEALQELCDTTQWNSSIVFACNELKGGVGNIRNSILSCVRYAISAGASLVIPTIVVRDNINISNIYSRGKAELSYIFDTQHFVDSVQLSCPSLHIHNHTIQDFQDIGIIASMGPEEIVEYLAEDGFLNASKWRGTFYKWLEEQSIRNMKGPMIVNLVGSFFRYPIYTDGEEFARSFGNILKFRSEARILATKIIQRMARLYSFSLDQSLPILPSAYFGVHLRTDMDAGTGFPETYSRYQTQKRHYLEQASHSNYSVIYVASGNLSEIAKFSHNAAASHNMTAINKYELLEGEDLEALQDMTWDQQARVDWLVLLGSSNFAGVAHSSFSWNIALKRHLLSKEEKYLEGPQMLSDELSQVYGPPRGYPEFAACMWP